MNAENRKATQDLQKRGAEGLSSTNTSGRPVRPAGGAELSDPEAETGEAQGRLQIRVFGIVQGVGFRPFVFHVAGEEHLNGWVRNDENGVTVEVEGPNQVLLRFLNRIQTETPPASYIYAVDHRFLAPVGYSEFRIEGSRASDIPPRVWILPDLATCPECRREILDPEDRRFRYAFTNCTHCGPRFTIIADLPYDRPNTSMRPFKMCPECWREYENPSNRRFHAQPNACPRCGPRPAFQIPGEAPDVFGREAIQRAVRWLREGRILAVKGLGGFHLMVDASKEASVQELRRRKKRPFKPFAVMYPDLETLRAHARIPDFAESLLLSTQAPILLLERRRAGRLEIANAVAPRSPYLGVFLPYTPLHHLLLQDLKVPLVATSGNASDEPIVHENEEALLRLSSLCDAFLTHDRPILRQVDDSVLQIISRPASKPQMLRRARGFTPLPVLCDRELPHLLALGGHQNSTFALSRGKEIILSQYLGDLDNYETRKSFERVLDDFLRLYEIHPQMIVHDLHPDYYTTELASLFSLPTLAVQHHHAHLAACMLENQLEGTTLGFCWDGTGYGTDKTVWGGETLLGDPGSCERVASLQPFLLPGGEKSIREPWRVALSLLHECYGQDIPRHLPLFHRVSAKDVALTLEMLEKKILSPLTSSVGRLFDGVSALLGISLLNSHQAQSAQLLEYAAWEHGTQRRSLPISVRQTEILLLDWRETVRTLVEMIRRGDDPAELASLFHHALADGALQIATALKNRQVILSGGVFCNRYLTESLLELLKHNGFEAFIHTQLPPNDGSLAVGQLWAAVHCRESSLC